MEKDVKSYWHMIPKNNDININFQLLGVFYSYKHNILEINYWVPF